MIAKPAREMSNPSVAPDIGGPRGAPERDGGRLGFPRFAAMLVLGVLLLRTFACAPFTIPSESMLPALQNGDYLVATKWPYGYSRWSVPFGLVPFDGVIAQKAPERGDIAIFRHPVDGSDYIKRVIGLPGDTVTLARGVVMLNGKPLPRRRVEDFRVAVSPNTGCAWGAAKDVAPDGTRICRYARFEETLPSGKRYAVLDFGATPQDRFGPVTVPDGMLFLLGDNRDNSQDSRFAASAGGGIGLVPAKNLLARAGVVLLSVDGSAVWYNPVSWFTALRWHRMGERL